MRSTARSLRLVTSLSLSALLLTACFIGASRPAAAFGLGGFGRGAAAVSAGRCWTAARAAGP